MGRIKELNPGGAVVSTDKIGLDRVSPDESMFVTALAFADFVLTYVDLTPLENDIASNTAKILQTQKNQTHLLAIADIDSQAPENTGRFYDLFDGTNGYSQGQLDEAITTLSGPVSIGATTLPVNDASVFSIGQEVTIQDETNIERAIISNIVANDLTVPALTYGYLAGMIVYRGNTTIKDGKLKIKDLLIDPVETLLSDPAILPTGQGKDCSFSPNGDYLAVVGGGTPSLIVYKKTGGVYVKMSDLPNLPTGTSYGCDFSDDGLLLAVGTQATPYLIVYSRSGDVFTKLSDPATLPGSKSNGVSFSGDGVYLAVGMDSAPHLSVYKATGGTYEKLADLSTLPAGDVDGVSFSDDGVYLATAGSGGLFIYKRSGDVFTKLDDPATMPVSTQDCSFSPNGDYLAIVGQTSPYLYNYKRNGDVFTKLDNPATLPGISFVYGVDYSKDGSLIALAGTNSPYLIIYSRSGDVFTKLPNLNPSYASGQGVSIASDNSFIAFVGETANYLSIYEAGLLKFLSADVRYNILPTTTASEFISWITRDKLTGFSLDGAVSIVDSAVPEDYEVLDKATAELEGDFQEDTFTQSIIPTAEDKVTLRVTMTRATDSDDVSITEILGAID